MADLHYEHPKLAEIYDLDNGWSKDRAFYLTLAGDEPKRVLDLGCGTGLLSEAIAEIGHQVIGIDPSLAMLEIGRNRPYGNKVQWLRAEAQNFATSTKFDLIVMTGHVLQVFLDDEDLSRVFENIRAHLSSSGQVAFETRSPKLDWAKRWDGMEINHQTSRGKLREVLRVLSQDGSRIRFETKYIFPDEELSSLSELRFWSMDEVSKALNRTGLVLKQVFGDWDKRGVQEESEELIFIAEHGTTS